MSDTATSPSLVEALSREIARVTAKRERWESYRRDQPGMFAGMAITLQIMNVEIEAAQRAMGRGDIAEMATAYESLKGYSDND